MVLIPEATLEVKIDSPIRIQIGRQEDTSNTPCRLRDLVECMDQEGKEITKGLRGTEDKHNRRSRSSRAEFAFRLLIAYGVALRDQHKLLSGHPVGLVLCLVLCVGLGQAFASNFCSNGSANKESSD